MQRRIHSLIEELWTNCAEFRWREEDSGIFSTFIELGDVSEPKYFLRLLSSSSTLQIGLTEEGETFFFYDAFHGGVSTLARKVKDSMEFKRRLCLEKFLDHLVPNEQLQLDLAGQGQGEFLLQEETRLHCAA